MAPIGLTGDVSITGKPFASRAQQRWAFATDQDFAKRWANETGSTPAFRRLPEKVARKSKSAQRRMVEMERAEKAGERIGGQLCRSKNGLFVNCNSGQATPESISKLRKQAGIADTPADTGPDTSGASKLTQETIAKRRAAIAARRAEADKKKGETKCNDHGCG
jgi:hypothetical protein